MSPYVLLVASLALFSGGYCTGAIENENHSEDAFLRSTLFPPTETNVSLVRFYLWTRANPGVDDFDELYVGDEESVLDSHFDAGRKTKVLAHGWTSDGFDSFVTNATMLYLEKGKIPQPTNGPHFNPNFFTQRTAM